MVIGTNWFSKALRATFGLTGQEAGQEVQEDIQPVFDLSPGCIPFRLKVHVAGATTAVGTVEAPTAYTGTDPFSPGALQTYGGYTIPANTPFKVILWPSMNGGALGAGDYVQIAGTNFVLRTGLDFARHTFESGWVIHSQDITLVIGSNSGAAWQGWITHHLYLLPTQS